MKTYIALFDLSNLDHPSIELIIMAIFFSFVLPGISFPEGDVQVKGRIAKIPEAEAAM